MRKCGVLLNKIARPLRSGTLIIYSEREREREHVCVFALMCSSYFFIVSNEIYPVAGRSSRHRASAGFEPSAPPLTTSILLSSVVERFFHWYTPIATPAAIATTTPNPLHTSAMVAHLGKDGDGEVGEEQGSQRPLPVMSSHQAGSGHVCEHE